VRKRMVAPRAPAEGSGPARRFTGRAEHREEAG